MYSSDLALLKPQFPTEFQGRLAVDIPAYEYNAAVAKFRQYFIF